jgi:hypothetical protein
MVQQSVEKMNRLEAEIKKLQARDVEWQDEILGIQRQLNRAESNASQLASRVTVLESEVVRGVQDLSEETARHEVADGRLSAFQTVAASNTDAVLGAGSSSTDPFEHLRQVPECPSGAVEGGRFGGDLLRGDADTRGAVLAYPKP